MKKLFGICLDKNSDGEISEEKFLVKSYEDDNLFESLEEITKRYESALSKSRFTSTVKYLAISVISIAATLISYKIVAPFTEAENASPLPLFIPMFFALMGIIMMGYYRKSNTAFQSSEDVAELNRQRSEETQKLYSSVGIPDTAISADILDYSYCTDKNGNEKTDSYVSLNRMWIYEQEDKVYFSDEYSLYAFPKSGFKEIKYVESKYTAFESSWNKSKAPTSEEFASCGIFVSNGVIVLSEYLSVILEADGEEYELRLPSYEAAIFSKLTGLYPKR